MIRESIFRDPMFNSHDSYTFYPISLFLLITRTHKLVIRSDGNSGLEYRIKRYLTETLETLGKLPGIKCRASRNRYYNICIGCRGEYPQGRRYDTKGIPDCLYPSYLLITLIGLGSVCWGYYLLGCYGKLLLHTQA